MRAGWTTIALAEVIDDARTGFASGSDIRDGVLQVRMNNITRSGRLDFAKQRRVVVDRAQLDRFSLAPGDILFNSTNSPELVGKAALFEGLDEPVVFSNHFVRLRLRATVASPSYLSHWLHYQFQRGGFDPLKQQWVNQASIPAERLLRVPVPIPPLEEQRRIALILDVAYAAHSLRGRAIAEAKRLPDAIFRKTFERDGLAQTRLGDVADIGSGITKGRKPNGHELQAIPYLTVANVQAGYLALGSVKTIDATRAEAERFRLLPGDVLLTEGGDPDKLGRGALWSGEIHGAIHQNHIFRVRSVDPGVLHPVYLQAEIASPNSRRYFLRAAKQTTGIASINKSQLSDLPVRVPSISQQHAFVDCINSVTAAVLIQQRHHAALVEAVAGLQARAFVGEL